jgi:hypothetical protein
MRRAKNERTRVERLEVREDAKRALTRAADEYGTFESRLASRLVDWFVRQEPTVQAIVLGFYPERVEPDVAALILRHLRTM